TVLAKQDVTVDPQGKSVKVRLVHQPKEPGEKVYVLDTPVREDEARADNNALERRVFVHEAKLIKVLYVEGYPRYDYRFIKTRLDRESARIKGNKTIDLKVLLLDADPDYAIQDRSALADFPTRQELNQFDVVILGDVEPKKQLNERLKDLTEFVRER